MGVSTKWSCVNRHESEKFIRDSHLRANGAGREAPKARQLAAKSVLSRPPERGERWTVSAGYTGSVMNERAADERQTTQLTQLLHNWQTGNDEQLLGQIVPAVYDELHRLARSYMRHQPQSHTLQATALINEAFCRVGSIKTELESRSHFIGIVANIMRQILVDHARARNSQKRGGGVANVPIDDVPVAARSRSEDVIALDEVLASLEKTDPRKVRIAELVYFCGATHKEAAEALEISESTLLREMRMLKSLLSMQLRPT